MKFSSKSILMLSAFLLVLLTIGCGGIAKMAGATRIMGEEIVQIDSMKVGDLEGLLSSDITLETFNNSPESTLGKYVKLKGTADLKILESRSGGPSDEGF